MGSPSYPCLLLIICNNQKQQGADAKAESEKRAEELKETEASAQDTVATKAAEKEAVAQRPKILTFQKKTG